MKLAIPFGAMGLGGILLAASIVWPIVFPSTSYWNEADEQRLTEVQAKVHNLSYLVAEAEVKVDPRKNRMSGEKMMEYRELKTEAQDLLDRRDSAIERPGYISKILRFTGIGSLFLGIAGYYVVQQAE